MKRTLLGFILAVCLMLACSFAWSACTGETPSGADNPPPVSHGAASAWSHDDQTHWKTCIAEGCDEKFGEGEHLFSAGTCALCGYTSNDVFSYIDSGVYGLLLIVRPDVSGDIQIPAEHNGQAIDSVCFGTYDPQSSTFTATVFPEITSVTIPATIKNVALPEAGSDDDTDYFPKLTAVTVSGDEPCTAGMDLTCCLHLRTVYAPTADCLFVKGDHVDVTAKNGGYSNFDIGDGTLNLVSDGVGAVGSRFYTTVISAKVVNLDEAITYIGPYNGERNFETLNAPGVTQIDGVWFGNTKVINAPRLESITGKSFCDNDYTELYAPNIKRIDSSSFNNSGMSLVIHHNGAFTIEDTTGGSPVFRSLTITAGTVRIAAYLCADEIRITAKELYLTHGLSGTTASFDVEETVSVSNSVSASDLTIKAAKLVMEDSMTFYEREIRGGTVTLDLDRWESNNGYIFASERLNYNVAEFSRTQNKPYRPDYESHSASLYIGEKVRELPDLFSGYMKITEVIFAPDCRLETIRSYAFSKLQQTQITLPDSVKTVEPYAFSHSSLDEIHHADALRIPYSAVADCFAYVPGMGGNSGYALELVDGVYYFDVVTAVQLKKDTDGFVVIREGTKYIEESAFEDQTGITGVQLPSTLVFIGQDAFAGCTGLESVTIPAGVTFVADYAFRGCERLEFIHVLGDLILSENVTDSPLWKGQNIDGLYYKGTKLVGIADTAKTFIYIKDGTTAMADDVFKNNTIFRAVYIPATLKLANGAFEGCSASARYLFKGTFQGGKGIQISQALYNVDVDPNGFVYSVGEGEVTLVGYYGEAGDIVIPAAYLEKPVTVIGELAFANNTTVTKVVIGENVLTIYGGAFGNCVNLEEVSISSNLRMMNNLVFSGCTGLKKVTVEGDAFRIYPLDYDPTTGAAPIATVSTTDPDLITYLTNTYTDYLWIRNLTLSE